MNVSTSFDKLLLLTACLSVFSVQAGDQTAPKVGDKPPLLQAATLLQAPPGKKLNAQSLRGKVVVLEFWATWCGPCVGAIPHLNDLAEKFKDKPVQFIAITAEDEATIQKFLAKRPIKAWVALDTDRAMNKAYDITAIPHTVVLGKDGKIAAITHPTMLTEKNINDLLAGEKIFLAGSGGGLTVTAGKDPADKNQAPPLFQVLIRPSNYTNAQGAGWGNGRLTATGYTVKDMVPIIFDLSSDRIVTNTPLPEGRYDFVVNQPPGADEAMEGPLQAAVKSAFGLTARRETNQLSALILKAKSTPAPGLVLSPTEGRSLTSRPGSVAGVGVSMTQLVSLLENALKTPVVDETGLTNRYDVSLEWKQASWDKPDLEAVKKAVRKQLGLELVPGERPIEVLVIDRVKKNEEAKGR